MYEYSLVLLLVVHGRGRQPAGSQESIASPHCPQQSGKMQLAEVSDHVWEIDLSPW